MAEESENQEAPEKKSKKLLENKVVLATAVFLVCVGIGAPIGYLLVPKAPQVEAEPEVLPAIEEHHTEESHMALLPESQYEEIVLLEGEEAPGAIAPFEAFLANLDGGKYIRLQLQVEFNTPDIPPQLTYKMVKIRDEILNHLTQQSATELLLPSGKKALKEMSRKIINDQFKREVVRNIFFTQFVIQ